MDIPIYIRCTKSVVVFLIVLSYITGCDSTTGIVEIPDPAFIEALQQAGVDRNNDGTISFREAERVEVLRIEPGRISDLTGIGSFIALDTLSIVMNPLKNVDLSMNSVLRYLELQGCGLENLDVSSNYNLTYLDCSGMLAMESHLESLDLSNNIELGTLICSENDLLSLNTQANINLRVLKCGYNRIDKIDVSGNTMLEVLACNNNLLEELHVEALVNLQTMISCGNRLTRLDLSSNTSLTRIGIDNMPMLTEVCVWTLPFPPEGVSILMGFSPNVLFITGCL